MPGQGENGEMGAIYPSRESVPQLPNDPAAMQLTRFPAAMPGQNDPLSLERRFNGVSIRARLTEGSHVCYRGEHIAQGGV